jgi:hypothetical protein
MSFKGFPQTIPKLSTTLPCSGFRLLLTGSFYSIDDQEAAISFASRSSFAFGVSLIPSTSSVKIEIEVVSKRVAAVYSSGGLEGESGEDVGRVSDHNCERYHLLNLSPHHRPRQRAWSPQASRPTHHRLPFCSSQCPPPQAHSCPYACQPHCSTVTRSLHPRSRFRNPLSRWGKSTCAA